MCILIISFTVIFGMSCERHMEQQVSYTEADSLNHLAYDMRYKDLSVAMKAAKRACQLAEGNSDLRAEALNNMGFCAFMRMDFEKASSLYLQALKEEVMK